MSLCNDDPIAGLQVQIIDLPDQLDVVDVLPSDRLPESLTLSWQEQTDGSFIVVIFSLTGDDIPAGTGPVASFVYQSTSIYESTISLSFIESVLSDDLGQEVDHGTQNGTVYVNGEEPPPAAPDTPTGLTAEAGDSEVTIFWNPSFGADEYLVYRNGQNIATTTETSYLDSGLFNGNQYCYFVVARNVTGDSGASSQACATPEGPPPLYPPEDLVAIGQIGNIELSWDAPQDSGSDDGLSLIHI